MQNVYIILSRSKTILARMIQAFTRKKYNHSSLALTKDCGVFYSFGRRNPRHMFPAGFIIEGVDSGFFALHKDVPVAIYELPVTEEQYALIKERLQPFVAEPKKYKYSVQNLVFQALGIPHPLETEYVCSAFIATILDGILDMGKPASLVFPHDFQGKDLEMIYEGLVGEYTAYYNEHFKEEELDDTAL